MTTQIEIAKRALGLLDLTSLGTDDDDATVSALCERASGPWGAVAAVCIWPRFVSLCRQRLAGTEIRVAAVANFPEGSDDILRAVAETKGILDAGGDEVDVVLPYNAWLNGRREQARELVSRCKEACGPEGHLKVILETGRLGGAENVAAAARDALDAGADFIKTSTGKTEKSATPEAAAVMLAAICEAGLAVGFKAAGGIRTVQDAGIYLGLADLIMGPEWASPATFRLGASSLLDNLLAETAE